MLSNIPYPLNLTTLPSLRMAMQSTTVYRLYESFFSGVRTATLDTEPLDTTPKTITNSLLLSLTTLGGTAGSG